MSITVQVPMALRADCGGAKQLQVSATTVRGALDELARGYPALYRSVCDETGAVRQHINLFINDSLVDKRNGLHAALNSEDVFTIMPAVSGG